MIKELVLTLFRILQLQVVLVPLVDGKEISFNYTGHLIIQI